MLASLAIQAGREGPGSVRGLGPSEWDALLALAEQHGVLPLLHRVLGPGASELGIPASVQARLREGHRRAGIQNTLLFVHLGSVLSRMGEARIPVVVLKGAHLAELVYEEVALRPMADVDLLVRPEHLAAAAHILGALGYHAEGVHGDGRIRPQEAFDGNLHVDPLVRPGGPRVELHYAIAIPDRMGDVDTDGLWDRALEVRIGGAAALVLAPEDLLIHLGTHLALHHGFAARLIQVWDLPAVIRHHGERLDWSTLWSRARRCGAERAVDTALTVAERLLNWRRPEVAQRPCHWPEPDFDAPAVAERLLFQEPPSSMGSANLPRLWSGLRTGALARLILSRAFPSRREMAFRYGVPERSPRILALYPLRIAELFGRHTGSVLRVLMGDRRATAGLQLEHERLRLQDWLAG